MFQKQVFNNGLIRIVSEMPQVRSVSVSIFVGAGGCYEQEGEAGISHFIEHLCFKGTAFRKTSREISEAIESTGGLINGGTDKELTVYWCKIASQHLKLAIDVLTDMVRNSRFDVDDIEKERTVIIEEINMSYDNPQQFTDLLLYNLLWPEQPLGRDIAGAKKTVQKFTRDDLVNFLGTHYVPNNIVISIAGGVNSREVADILSNNFSDWAGSQIRGSLSSETIQKEPNIKVEYRDIEQVQICLGFHGLSITNPDRFAVDILNTILGEGMSSRLFIELREKRGLAYEVGSGVDHFRETGDLVIHAGVDRRNTEAALSIILEQLSLLKNSINSEDLLRAKEMIKGRQILALENTTSVANWLGAQQMLTGKILNLDEVTALIDKVTLEDLQRIAQQLFVNENLNLAIVGPLKDSQSLLKQMKL